MIKLIVFAAVCLALPACEKERLGIRLTLQGRRQIEHRP